MVGVLIRMKLMMMRHAVSRRRIVGMLVGGVFGLALAAGTVLLGTIDFGSPRISTDMLATMFLLWTLGWVFAPIASGRSDDLLRPQYFRLLPVSAGKLARGMLVASLIGVAPVITFVSLLGLVVHGGQLGAIPVVVSVVGVLLEFAFVMALSRVATATLGVLLSSRRGRDVGMAILVLVICCGWMVRFPLRALVPRLAKGQAPGFSLVVRLLPTGWASVATESAATARWLLVIGPLVGLAVLTLLLARLFGVLLRRRMTSVAASGGGHDGVRTVEIRRRLLPDTAAGGMMAKEVRTWFRDIMRNFTLMGVVIAAVFVAVAPAMFGSSSLVPYGGLIAVVIAATLATNLYGMDGGALWITLVTPNAERPDVRGRQWAWLVIIGPATILVTVLPTILGGSDASYAFPWVLSLLPALLGGGAGMTVLQSVYTPYPMPDPRAGNPLAFRSRMSPIAAFASIVGMTLLVLIITPAGLVVLAGQLAHSVVLSWLGVPIGIATGVVLFWWWGKIAYHRLQRRGPELLQLVRKAV